VLRLPEQAPFGRVHVDKNACTLCFACASVCPVQALQTGGEQPRLNFVEDNCVQCGLCEQSCPERAISLERRFVFSSTRRKQASVLNEEEPFACIRCGKPFTTRRMIDHMTEKLAGHWMFKDQGALARLKMCENCRVEDMYVAHQQTH
jgi:formate hydrogenlyase subunit 6/NADH:ubiquinone oxidoreductase subunit I